MKKKILIVVVVGLAIAAGIFIWTRNRHRGNDRTLTLYGNVDIRDVDVGFRVSGRVLAVLKDEGDPVHAGEMLAKLDEEPYQLEADQAGGRVAAAQSQLQLLKAGYRPEEIAEARATVRAREVGLENAKRLFERRQALVATKTIPEENFTDAEAAYHEAEAQLKAAEAQLELREAGYRKEDIARAQASSSRPKPRWPLRTCTSAIARSRHRPTAWCLRARKSRARCCHGKDRVDNFVEQTGLGARLHRGARFRAHSSRHAGERVYRLATRRSPTRPRSVLFLPARGVHAEKRRDNRTADVAGLPVENRHREPRRRPATRNARHGPGGFNGGRRVPVIPAGVQDAGRRSRPIGSDPEGIPEQRSPCT